MNVLYSFRCAAVLLAGCTLFLLISVDTLPAQSTEFELIGRWANGNTEAVGARENTVYLGNGAYLMALDVSDPDSPEELGRLLLGGVVQDMVLGPDHAYITDDLGTLYVVDIRVPAEPRLVNERSFAHRPTAMTREGPYLYIAHEDSTVHVLDLSDPAAPVTLSAFSAPSQILALAGIDTYLYVGTRDHGILIVDVAEPALPREAGIYAYDPRDENWIYDPGPMPVRDIAIRDPYAFIAADGDGLLRLDISERTNPVLRGQTNECPADVTCNPFQYVRGVELHGDHAYVTSPSSVELRIFRIASPEGDPLLQLEGTLNWVKTFKDGSISHDTADITDLAFVGDNMYAAMEPRPGLCIIDIADPQAPKERVWYDTKGDGARGLVFADPYLFVASYAAGLQVLDVSDPTRPIERGAFRPVSDHNFVSRIYDLTIASDNAFVVGNGFFVLDIKDPDNLREIWREQAWSQGLDNPQIVDDVLYISNGYWGTKRYDVSVPKAPIRLGGVSSDRRTSFIEPPYVYVVTSELIAVWDISDRANPVFVDRLQTGYIPLTGLYQNPYLYLVTSDGFRVLEYISPFNLQEVGFAPLGDVEGATLPIVSDSVAYIAGGRDGLIMVDVRDPTQPQEIARYDTPYSVGDVELSADLIFLADNNDGVYILRRDLVFTHTSATPVDDTSVFEVYPSPSRQTVNIRYSLKAPERVRLTAYDALGRSVGSIFNGIRSAGTHTEVWSHTGLASGVYLIHLETDSKSQTKRLVVAK